MLAQNEVVFSGRVVQSRQQVTATSSSPVVPREQSARYRVSSSPMPENSAKRRRHSILSFPDRGYFHMGSESSPRPKCRKFVQLPLKGFHEVVHCNRAQCPESERWQLPRSRQRITALQQDLKPGSILRPHMLDLSSYSTHIIVVHPPTNQVAQRVLQSKMRNDRKTHINCTSEPTSPYLCRLGASRLRCVISPNPSPPLTRLPGDFVVQ
jgi:hypothetical protein